MASLAKKIKQMEKDRAEAKSKAPKVNPGKTCPSCFADISSMKPSHQAQHLDRCM